MDMGIFYINDGLTICTGQLFPIACIYIDLHNTHYVVTNWFAIILNWSCQEWLTLILVGQTILLLHHWTSWHDGLRKGVITMVAE